MLDNENGAIPLSQVNIFKILNMTFPNRHFFQTQFSSSSFGHNYISLDKGKGWKPIVNNRQQYMTVSEIYELCNSREKYVRSC